MKITKIQLTLGALKLLASANPVATVEDAQQVEYIVGAPLIAPSAKSSDGIDTRAASTHFPLKQIVLDHHNAHRKNHSASPLVWNADMERNAQVLARRCVFQHNVSIGGQAYGQNLAAGWKRHDIGDAITDGWYGEYPAYKNDYGLGFPSNFEDVGHFTQVVWLGTTSVGCATHDCAHQGGLRDSTGSVLVGLDNFTVCDYSPPGNYVGDFGTNVLKSIGLPPYQGP